MNKISQQNVEVLINDKPVRIFAHNGRLYVEAKENQEYSIRLRNDSYSRVLGVCSVDGMNVLDGEIACSDSYNGYIVRGRDSYIIKGWRVSNDKVNAFAFGKKDQSYAAKSEATDGDTSNVGVIGVRFYSEKAKPAPTIVYRDRIIEKEVPVYPRRPILPWRPYPYEPYWTSGGDVYDSTTFSCSTSVSKSADISRGVTRSVSLNNVQEMGFSPIADNVEFDIGTVFTDKEVEDKVTNVEFEQGRLLEFVEIYYASRAQLEAMGVPIKKEAAVNFPTSFQGAGYCKPPRK